PLLKTLFSFTAAAAAAASCCVDCGTIIKMGKSSKKSSRKGKKAWRANISTADVEDYFEKSTKDALTGGSLASAPDDSLFFLDKSTDFSVKRKIDKNRDKILHCDRSLQKNPFVVPVPSSILKKSKKAPKVVVETTKDVSKDQVSGMVDLWDTKGLSEILFLADEENDVKAVKKSKPSLIPAVEVEPPGCSFNPSFEDHQDSLASAVAEEMQKVYKSELGPLPVPLTVPGEVVDEESMYLLDVDDENDDDLDENLENTDTGTERPSKRKRVTRVELNKRIRRKEKLKTETEAKKIEKLSKEIDSLPDILEEIAKDDEEKQKRHVRRATTKQERLKSGPPRLGRQKFVPAPSQVLLSEEITGSLRKLKGCCTLTRDRFKSLQKRGLIVPGTKRKSSPLNDMESVIHPEIVCVFASVTELVDWVWAAYTGRKLYRCHRRAERLDPHGPVDFGRLFSFNQLSLLGQVAVLYLF
ncbi:hypothetical protein IFM89_036794, partial [Coptis chinensis]